MSSFGVEVLNGVRVVRGPDWKWGDADGGEGNAGTVFTTKIQTAGIVNVVWDAGNTGQYRCGYQSSYDLRVINNSSTGIKHSISCGTCLTKEISGIRWQCVTCELNICTHCFLKEGQHHPDHRDFKRFDNSQITDPPIVAICGNDGSQRRLKLIGIYPGAKVTPFSILSYGFKCSKGVGTIIPDPNAESLGELYVEWSGTKEKEKFQRCSAKGNLILNAKELVSGGFYNPDAFPILKVMPIPSGTEHLRSLISQGDLLQIRTSKLHLINPVDENFGYKVPKDLIKRATGIVESVFDSENIIADFDGFKLHLNPYNTRKLNKFSVNDVIRIRSDIDTIREIEKEYGQTCQNFPVKLNGEIGRVIGTFKEDPKRLFIKFDNYEIYNWLGDREPLPSSWMKLYESANPAVDWELDEISRRTEWLFYDAVKRGDMRIVKLIYYRHAVDINATVNGKSAVYAACKKGEEEILSWLLDQPEIDIERENYLGFRAIHQAVIRCNPNILEMLIRKGARMDCPNANGETPLHLAISKKFKDCARLLIHHGCDVHLQDRMGNSPLHYAILVGIGPEIIQLLVTQLLKRNLPGSILEAKNKSGLTALLLACYRKDLASIELLVKAGANAKAVDDNDNSAVLLATSSADADYIPVKELSPSIFKIYQNALLDESNAKLMERHPILSLLAYLIRNGCSLDTSNRTSQKASDILLEKGFPKDIFEVLDRTAAKRTKKGCACGQEALYSTYCPRHKIISIACEQCFRQNASRKQDCGCAAEEEEEEEQVAPVPPPALVQQMILKKKKKRRKTEIVAPEDSTSVKEENAGFVFKWSDGPKKGIIQDQFDNVYVWNNKVRNDGGIGYRCTSEAGVFEHQKCPAVARRYVNSLDGTSIIILEMEHLEHRSSTGKTEQQQTPEGPKAGPSCAKRQRRSM